MTKKYRITRTKNYNGYKEIEANCDDFPDDGRFGLADFSFGEATADYADEIIE